MNTQQARIRARLEALIEEGIRDSLAVPIDTQLALAADGYALSALDDDLND